MSNPFDLGNIGGLLGGLQQRMEQAKADIAALEVEGQAASGLVKVRISGEFEVRGVDIAEGAMDDREMLEDLVVAAQNDAVRVAKERIAEMMQAVTGGLPIPPGMLPF